MGTATATKSRLEVLGEVLHRRYYPADQFELVEDFSGDGRKGVAPMRRKVTVARNIRHRLYRFYTTPEQELFPFFEPVRGLKKMCDYILFAEEGAHLFCLLVEMKESSGGASPQLKAAEAFVRFILDAIIRVGLPFSMHNVHFRFISINQKGSQKPGERESDPDYNADHWMKLTAHTVWLAQLLK